MDAVSLIAGAMPATLAAVAAIIAARRTGIGNHATEDVRQAINDLQQDIERLSKKVSQHVENRRIHRG
jgi:hypothetical protein